MEQTPLFEATESHIRKIRRIQTKENNVHDNSDQLPRTTPGGSLNQPIQDPSSSSIITEEVTDSNNMPRTLEESVPRFCFGPLYAVDLPSVTSAKDRAWEHVMKNSADAPDVDASVTTETYIGVLSKVQTEAEEAYGESLSVAGSDFRWMMIKDGCLFLQLALLILGASPEELSYTSNDPIFGVKENKKDVKVWVESMFFVGNQLPLVVLKELMNQRFFQDVVNRVKWDPSPARLCNKVLYELLGLPALKRRSLIRRLMGNDSSVGLNRSSDLLHCLENLVAGTERPGYLNREFEAIDDLDDLEANEEEFTICEGTVTDDNEDRLRGFPNAVGITPGDVAGQTRQFRSATDLKLAGINIKKLEGGGTKRIYFKSCWLCANLYLPSLSVDEHTEVILQNLKTYEVIQQQGRHKHHVGSYLKFMSGLIQTTKDVKLLECAGVIDGLPTVKEKLPRIFSRLSCDVKRLTREFRILEGQISNYSSPIVHFKNIINVVAILTLLQFIIGVLAYVKPLN